MTEIRQHGVRIAVFENAIIQHQALETAFDGLTRLHSRYLKDDPLRAQGLIIAGSSGAGKTTVVEAYMRKNNPPKGTRNAYGDGLKRTIVYLEVPHRPNRRRLFAAILMALGMTDDRRETADEIQARLATLLVKLEVEMLILDEAHHLVTRRNPDDQEEMSESIKSFLNWCPAQVVLCGLPDLLALQDFSQMDKRLSPPEVLEPYDWGEDEGRAEFCILLEEFEKSMGLTQLLNLGEPDLARRMYCATGGHIGLVSKLLSHALSLCLEREMKGLTLDILAEVYAAGRKRPSVQVNPDPYAASEPRSQTINPDASPFLAGRTAFLKLWRDMAQRQKTMVAKANNRRVAAPGPGEVVTA